MDRFHPADDRLIAMYFGDEAANADEGRAVRQHLHGCETCTWRYTELTAPLERLRQDAASEADEVFTPERLAQQHARILDRLEAPADSRVIPFPGSTTRLDRAMVHRPLSRWVAAAAAAGLLIGAGGSWLLETGGANDRTPAPLARAARPAMSATAPESDAPSASLAEPDEMALREIDQAVHTQRIEALSALDELTPHIRPESMLARARIIR
jgi:anti-sigma factor RsiW